MSAFGNLPAEIAARRIFADAKEELANAPQIGPQTPFSHQGTHDGIRVVITITES